MAKKIRERLGQYPLKLGKMKASLLNLTDAIGPIVSVLIRCVAGITAIRVMNPAGILQQTMRRGRQPERHQQHGCKGTEFFHWHYEYFTRRFVQQVFPGCTG